MDILVQVGPMLAIVVVFYLLLLLPEKKRKKQYAAMLEGLQLNDEIITRGGVIGKIVSLEVEEMILESGPNNVRIKFAKSSIASKIYKQE
ncbi:preprotein translocase subunit YajC [Clostridium vincentii]|uniref:Preprotein translocase subunit YajC n=1 Tax=Clostridium vincentii TaxID=52704 RepID=A0A2T0BBG9_9CLOT|nr:preprotein translocase subunit YajC [Clostridium vincentii]PRR81224.1 preprotein translocase subunit YajC [Clostridium vincentii]